MKNAILSLHRSVPPSVLVESLKTQHYQRVQNDAQLLSSLNRVFRAQMLAATGLDQLPEDTLLAILRDLKDEVQGMTAKQREHYAAKGRELLAKMNGSGK